MTLRRILLSLVWLGALTACSNDDAADPPMDPDASTHADVTTHVDAGTLPDSTTHADATDDLQESEADATDAIVDAVIAEADVIPQGDATPDAIADGGADADAGTVLDDRWLFFHQMTEALALLPAFGDSAPDTDVHTDAKSNTVYVDPTVVDDSGAGTFASPRKFIPSISNDNRWSISNMRVLIKAGTVVGRRGANGYMINGSTGFRIAAYNPTNGDEIVSGYPDVLARGLAGGWVTSTEISSLYFTFDGEAPADYAPNGEGIYTVRCIDNVTGVIRGARFINAGAAHLGTQNGCSLRVEDYILENVNRDPRLSTNHFGGNCLRGSGGLDMARGFIQANSEDVVWYYPKPATTRFRMVDFLIVSSHENQHYGDQHSDVWQFSDSSIAGVELRRGIVQVHQAKDGPFLADVDAGMPNTAPQGKGIISTGSSPAGGTPPLFEDLVIITNYDGGYIAGAGGYTRRRVVHMATPTPALAGAAKGQWTATSNGNFETDCVYVTVGGRAQDPLAGTIAGTTVTGRQTLALP